MKRIYVIIVSLLIASSPVGAQVRDSSYVPLPVHCDSERPKVAPAVIGGALFAAGTVVMATPSLSNAIDIPIRDSFAKTLSEKGDIKVDNYAQYLPMAGYLGLGYLIPSKHSGGERFLAGFTAFSITAVAVTSLKYTVARERPDCSSDNSFPSGHTATAFVGAALVSMEYGPWWGMGAYAVATGVGILRLRNNRHWASDVVAGASIGVLSAYAAYWLLPLERSILGLETKPYDLAVVPTGTGIALALSF